MRSLALLVVLLAAGIARADEPAFAIRGYYVTFMRMPTFGRSVWAQILDRIKADGGNTLILWTAGGFRSKRFPETWEYNRDHKNVRHDFVRDLIDDAHARGIKVLLGLTPFGYDGVNRMGLSHPDWKATGPDGQPTRRFGILCWGYNLCPGRDDTQRFMLDYAREMCFEFYPNADGLFIESSDYAACHCEKCGPKFFDNESRFVRAISDEVWARKPDATVVVYPHYFTGAKTPIAGTTAAKQPFDPRWTVFFTPHSAAVDAELVSKAKAAIWWDDAPVLHAWPAVRDGARRARAAGCSGYLPSLEAYSYVTAEPEDGRADLVGRRQAPFGFGWLREGEMPYDELAVRINRTAYREYTRDPDLSDEDFLSLLGRELFGSAANPQKLGDALFLQRSLLEGRTWTQAAPLADPARIRLMKERGQLSAEMRAGLAADLHRVRRIAKTYASADETTAEMGRIAAWVSGRWDGEAAAVLAP